MLGRLRPAIRPPFDLLQGDRLHNLRVLKEQEDAPGNDVSRKIWRLLRLGYSEEMILQGLELLGRASWTTTLVEQGHSAGSCLMKTHRMYGARTMQDRSCVISMAPLLSNSAAEKRLEMLKHRSHRLARQSPKHITGRQQMFKELHHFADKMRAEGHRLKHDFRIGIMKQHAKQWANMPKAQQLSFERRAAETRTKAEDDLLRKKALLRADMCAAEAAVQAELNRGGPLTLKQCRLKPEEMAQLDRMWNDVKFARPLIDRDVAQGVKTVTRPHLDVATALSRVDLEYAETKARVPPWAPLLCMQRGWFSTAAVRVDERGASTYWKVAHALQNPYLVTFVKLRLLTDPGAVMDGLMREGIVSGDWNYYFAVDSSCFVFSDDGPFDETATLYFMEGLVCVHGGFLVCDGAWHTFEQVSALFPPMRQRTETEVAEKVADPPELSPFEKFPWLQEYFDQDPWAHQAGGVGGKDTTKDGHRVEHAAEGAEICAEAVFDALMAKRDEWRDQHAEHATPDFSVELLGGAWTASHRGVSYDAFRGAAHAGNPQAFCELFGLQKSFRASIRLCTEPLANLIAQAWCSRMQFFYDKYHIEGCGADFSDEALASFAEDPEVAKAHQLHAGLVRQRLDNVRAMRPRRQK